MKNENSGCVFVTDSCVEVFSATRISHVNTDNQLSSGVLEKDNNLCVHDEEVSISEFTKTSDQYSALATSEEVQAPFKDEDLLTPSEPMYGLSESGEYCMIYQCLNAILFCALQ